MSAALPGRMYAPYYGQVPMGYPAYVPMPGVGLGLDYGMPSVMGPAAPPACRYCLNTDHATEYCTFERFLLRYEDRFGSRVGH